MTAAPVASLARYIDAVDRVDTLPLQGRVLRVVGLLIESEGPRARLGEVCDVVSGDSVLPVQVVGFRDGTLLTVPLGELAGIRPGLLNYAGTLPSARVLAGRYGRNVIALAVRRGESSWLARVSEFAARARLDGTVTRAVASAGLRGVDEAVD